MKSRASTVLACHLSLETFLHTCLKNSCAHTGHIRLYLVSTQGGARNELTLGCIPAAPIGAFGSETGAVRRIPLASFQPHPSLYFFSSGFFSSGFFSSGGLARSTPRTICNS